MCDAAVPGLLDVFRASARGRNTGTRRFSCSPSIRAMTSMCSASGVPRSFAPSPSSTWKIPALLDISISTRIAFSSPAEIRTSSMA